jgi:hydrogenase maturation factor
VSACGDEHCITCSDEGIEMHVLETGQNGLAVCTDATGGRSEVMTELVGPVVPGDAVLVHAGVVIARLQ